MITAAQWLRVLTYCGVQFARAAEWSKIFERRVQAQAFSLGAREIDDFVGQVLHETSMLDRLQEGLSYRADRIREIGNAAQPGTRWRSLVAIADKIERNPRAFANAAYGGRLGNVGIDDGFNYAGKGIPQITGRTNYEMLEKLTGLPLLQHPELLLDPDTAMRCGIAWWEARVPDEAIDNVSKVTRAVQGAQLGLPDRAQLTQKAGEALASFAG